MKHQTPLRGLFLLRPGSTLKDVFAALRPGGYI